MVAFDFDVVTGPDTASIPKDKTEPSEPEAKRPNPPSSQPVSPKTP